MRSAVSCRRVVAKHAESLPPVREHSWQVPAVLLAPASIGLIVVLNLAEVVSR